MREWIVTNGIGGYASLTHSNSITRKFHGLLVASLNPPVERWVFVSNILENIQMKDAIYPLQSGVFSFDTLPKFTYILPSVAVRKSIWMSNGENTTIIRYDVKTERPIVITHRILVNSRHFYDTYTNFSITQEEIEDGIKIHFNNTDKKLVIILSESKYKPEESWVTLQYPTDRIRNDAWEDHALYCGYFHKNITRFDTYYLIITIEDKRYNAIMEYEKEVYRRINLLEKSELPKQLYKLVLATDGFIVQRNNGKSVIAGYHWFSDWSRDTLISLPGLTLVTKRFEIAKKILLGIQPKNGLIPNTFNDKDNSPSYNSVDAPLWFIDRVFQYLKYTNDIQLLDKIWNKLESIIMSYKNGTTHGVHMDEDGLISHNPGLTWMDVYLNGEYSTPRSKKAVEIQALWYNALMIMSLLSKIKDKEDWYGDLARKVKQSFIDKYDRQYDVIDTKDTSCRPNKIFLVSLDFSMIDENLQREIVEDIEKNLLTIFGLRTLSPLDPKYKGVYIGECHRDLAYHNGIVWPWLLGPFIKAFIKTHGYRDKWREYAYKEFISPMIHVFGEKWDGFIPEIFDGDPPYTPRGCIAQAWSNAEILRSWVEDIMFKRPSYESLFLNEIRI